MTTWVSSASSAGSTARSTRGCFEQLSPLALVCSVVFLICAEASALMLPMATTTAVDRAECIVEGRVTKLTSRWTDDHSTIVTEVTLEPTDVLLGDTNPVQFVYAGGVVAGLELRVSDMPRLKNGEKVLVFLRSQEPHEAKRDRSDRHRSFTLLGAAQGLYRISGGRAVKESFTVLGDVEQIDRNVEITVLKDRIRQQLKRIRTNRSQP